MSGIDALVLDLDGVVRHFDPDHEADVCRRHGLEPGAIRAAVFASAVTEAVIVGRVTRDEWIAAVGEETGMPGAVAAWGVSPATVDEDVLAVVDEVRATGRPVVILTNGTDAIDEELAALDVVHRFDGIFNSAVIGHAKPDVRAFRPRVRRPRPPTRAGRLRRRQPRQAGRRHRAGDDRGRLHRRRYPPGLAGDPGGAGGMRRAGAVLLVVALLAGGACGDDAEPEADVTTTTTTEATTTTTQPPPLAATVTEEVEADGRYRQGLARVDDGWIFTSQLSLHRTDDDLALLDEDMDAIPEELKALTYDHIGDPDLYDGVLWVPIEHPAGKDTGEQLTARYDPGTLAYIDSFPVAQHHNAFIAVDDDGVFWSADEFSDDTLLRYRVEGSTVTMLEPLVMERTIERIQGADVAEGAIWLATDDERNGVYRVDPETGAVDDLGSMGRIPGEGEGIDATDLPSGLLHALVADENVVPIWLVHMSVAPEE